MTEQNKTSSSNQSQKTSDSDLKKKLEEAKKAAEQKDKQEVEKGEKQEIEKLKTELEKTREELEKMTEAGKRAMADMQNMRRRQEEDRKNLIYFAYADLIKEILPILDNLSRAKEHTPETEKEWFAGIEMSINQLKKVLENAGLKEIQSLGQPFNPDLHEAINQGPGEKNIVIEELEKGYTIDTRVIRHAKVKVGNGEEIAK